MEDNSQDTTSLPCNAHSLRLFAIGPEEVEEESCAEYECDEYSGKNVV